MKIAKQNKETNTLSYLLQAAVTLSQRNCCFELPIGLTEAKYRPTVAQADARILAGPLFGDESFHHILSHPPYKDCVAYSTHLEGDLSR